MRKRLNVVKVIVKMPKIDALDALGDTYSKQTAHLKIVMYIIFLFFIELWCDGGGWISSRSGWLLELLTELTNPHLILH